MFGEVLIRFHILAICLSLPACYLKAVDPADLAPLRTVTVLAAVGNEVTSDHVGLTIFNNTSKQEPFPELDLGQILHDEAQSCLSSNSDLTVLPNAMAPQKLYEHYQQATAYHQYLPRLLRGEAAGPILNRAQENARAVGSSAYLLLFPSEQRPCPHAGARYCGNYGLSGIGIWNQANPMLGGKSVLTYVLLHLEFRRTEDNKLLGAMLLHETESLQGIEFQESVTLYDASVRKRLADSLLGIIRRGLQKKLQELGLINRAQENSASAQE